MNAPVVLAADTRGWSSRGVWPGPEKRPVGELWLYQREDGRWDVLAADAVVAVSDKARQRLGGLQPRVASLLRWHLGAVVHFRGVRTTVIYRVIQRDQPHSLWLLRRER